MNSQGIRRVAVIGAGPGGAIATDALIKEQAFDVIRTFERKSEAGGTWVFNSSQTPGIPSLQNLIEKEVDRPVAIPQQLPCKETRSVEANSHQLRYSDSGVYEDLHSNLPPSTMSFTQEPLPDTLSQRTLSRYGQSAPFRHHKVIQKWVKDMFIRNDSHSLIEFNTTVEHVHKHDQKWILTLRKDDQALQQDNWWQEEFDAVVVATGHYNIPCIPDIPGLVDWEKQHPGTIQHSKHYRSVADYAGKKVIVVGGSVSAFDALHEIRTVSRRPVIASIRQPLAAFGWHPFTHPHIEVRPPITEVNPELREVLFSDGSKTSDVDVIFFATGYNFSFPFLPQVRISNGRIQGLYQHVFLIDDPSISFIGMVSGGLTFRVFEWQAVAVARFLAGRASLPSQSRMLQWERNRSSRVGNEPAFFNIASDYEGYFEGLRQFAGQPAAGTTGRVLPVFEGGWVKEFENVVRARIQWWEQEMEVARVSAVGSKGYLSNLTPKVRANI